MRILLTEHITTDMKIENGKYFEISYKLYRVNKDGSETLVHEVTADDPDRAVAGLTDRKSVV